MKKPQKKLEKTSEPRLIRVGDALHIL